MSRLVQQCGHDESWIRIRCLIRNGMVRTEFEYTGVLEVDRLVEAFNVRAPSGLTCRGRARIDAVLRTRFRASASVACFGPSARNRNRRERSILRGLRRATASPARNEAPRHWTGVFGGKQRGDEKSTGTVITRCGVPVKLRLSLRVENDLRVDLAGAVEGPMRGTAHLA